MRGTRDVVRQSHRLRGGVDWLSKHRRFELGIAGALYLRAPLPWDAAFLVGKAFIAYKRCGGTRTTPLPDFYIGAHAAIEHLAVLTRDARRFRTYFPTVEVLSPGVGPVIP